MGRLGSRVLRGILTLSVSVSADNNSLANATNVIDQQGQCKTARSKFWRIADGTLPHHDAQNTSRFQLPSRRLRSIAAGSEDHIARSGFGKILRVAERAWLQSYH